MSLRSVAAASAVVMLAATLHSSPTLAESAIQVVAGDAHTCALTPLGGVKCWGDNTSGELGDNSSVTSQTAPVGVFGLPSGATAITAGDSHSCAVAAGGAAKCWGSNGSGQLGDTTTIERRAPVGVSSLGSGVVALAGGRRHTCALLSTTGVKCWGENLAGQVGDGTSGVNRLTPLDVSGLSSGVTAIATGRDHSCALLSTGGMKCWGGNRKGQLGNGTTTDQLTPVDVIGLTSGVSRIAAGSDHTCALTTGGGVKCWGDNSTGQLGNNSISESAVPVNVFGFSTGAAAIAAGEGHTCAAASGGGLLCWGDNSSGQLGDGSLTQRLIPTSIPAFAASTLPPAAGKFHSCAITSVGGIKCWGANGSGQIGDNSNTQRLSPADVVAFDGSSVPQQFALTVTKPGSGSGTVTSSPTGIDCGATCSANFNSGTLVALTVTASAGSAFSGWGGACTGSATCQVAMDAARSVTATFNPVVGGSWLANISTRGLVLTGNDVMIGGFIIHGDLPKTVLITARGPSLAQFGITNPLANPFLQLFSGQSAIASNDDFGTAPNLSDILATGVAPTNPLESAIFITLNPGAYTAIVTGVGGGTGVAIVEVFAR